MKFYLSVIIPAFNASVTIKPLLNSLAKSDISSSFEIIVVDDASSDDTAGVVKGLANSGMFNDLKTRSLTVRLIRRRVNRGPAAARNKGAKKAKGEILLFLDSDVEVFRDTLSQVIQAFKSDPDIYALTGVWDKKQRTQKFFPRFKALRDWSYWINERDQRGYYYLFSTRVAAIRRDLFWRLGGFDERYTGASVEDIEFTYRIARRYAVVFNPKVRVRHEFEDFLPIAKKYFVRSREWSALYRRRGQFDPVATTRSEAITAISAVGLVIGLVALVGMTVVVGIMGEIWAIKEIRQVLSLVVLVLFLIHLWGVRKFLNIVYQEEGFVFAIKSFFMGLILYLVIAAGGLAFTWQMITKNDSIK